MKFSRVRVILESVVKATATRSRTTLVLFLVPTVIRHETDERLGKFVTVSRNAPFQVGQPVLFHIKSPFHWGRMPCFFNVSRVVSDNWRLPCGEGAEVFPKWAFCSLAAKKSLIDDCVQ